MLVYANHTIHHGDGQVQAPGAVFNLDLPEADVNDLVKREAVRHPTEDEVKLHKLANGEFSAVAAAPAPVTPTPVPEPGKSAQTKGDTKPEDDIG